MTEEKDYTYYTYDYTYEDSIHEAVHCYVKALVAAQNIGQKDIVMMPLEEHALSEGITLRKFNLKHTSGVPLEELVSPRLADIIKGIKEKGYEVRVRWVSKERAFLIMKK